MKNKKNVFLTLGQQYPLASPNIDGTAAEFLANEENILKIRLSNLSTKEVTAFRSGMMMAGFLYKNGALLWLFEFHDYEGLILTLDAPFDARIIPDELRSSIPKDPLKQRLSIQIHVVDELNILRALRVVSMPKDLTINFISSTQEQHSCLAGKNILNSWMKEKPHLLVSQCDMHVMGRA